jgi:O-antigen ligase
MSTSPYPAMPHENGTLVKSAVFICAFLLVWISTSPFAGEGEVAMVGNIANQLSFSAAALSCLLALFTIDRRALSAYVIPSYALLIAWLMVTVVTSSSFDVSLRAFMFTSVVITIAAISITLPTGERHFANLLGSAAGLVLGLCFIGLIVFPNAAVHTSGDLLEPEHAGAWRGLFDHKNIAGAMMGIFVMIGLFVARTRSRGAGYALAALAFLFLMFTKSKTTMGLTPFVLLWAMFAHRLNNLGLRALVCLGPLALLLTFTVGSVLLPPVKALLEVISPGQTFTGRTEIWDFAFDWLAKRPLLGFGFEAFWGSDQVKFAEAAEFDTGIANGMVHGHNSYVDLVMGLGIPGLLISAYVLLWRPLLDHALAKRFAENDALAELFVRIWLFSIYSACLESFFFRRADPVWFSLLIAILGLRLVASWRVAR